MKHSPETRMYLLAARFRGLINAPRINPVNAAALDEFAMREDICDTARFLLSVCDSQRPWKSGQFNVIDPVRAWEKDERMLCELIKWIEKPWWPHT